MGEDYYPMLWQKLKYDTRLDGYRVDMTEGQLKGAPKFDRNTDWNWSPWLTALLAPADQGRGDRARQQARQDGVGHDGQGRALQGTGRTCGVNEIASDIRRDVKVGRVNST